MGLSEDLGAASERAKTVLNEQAKLTATYLNGLAIAVFAVGGLAPLIAAGGTIQDFDPGIANGVVRFRISTSGASLVISLVCFAASGILHWVARRSLRNLR